jgi:hypothetical protein
MSRESEHTCHAIDCDQHVPPKYLMCRRHWFMVPMDLRGWVLATYTLGQEKLDGTADIEAEWFDYAQQAVDAVAKREGKL